MATKRGKNRAVALKHLCRKQFPPPRTERLRAGLSPNGKLVHLARHDGSPVCGSEVIATCWVHARITCNACRRARRHKAARLDGRPHVVGVNWEPMYRAIRKAVDRLDTKMPRLRTAFWPVLA